jgi:hypothetical protein
VKVVRQKLMLVLVGPLSVKIKLNLISALLQNGYHTKDYYIARNLYFIKTYNLYLKHFLAEQNGLEVTF